MSTIIDPRLPSIPATGVTYDDDDREYDTLPELLEILETEGSVIEYTYDDSEVETDDGDRLDPPSVITVISQTVKVGTAGSQTVDVVVDIEDVPGASEYERRDAV